MSDKRYYVSATVNGHPRRVDSLEELARIVLAGRVEELAFMVESFDPKHPEHDPEPGDLRVVRIPQRTGYDKGIGNQTDKYVSNRSVSRGRPPRH